MRSRGALVLGRAKAEPREKAQAEVVGWRRREREAERGVSASL
jgi:hypothetical protein